MELFLTLSNCSEYNTVSIIAVACSQSKFEIIIEVQIDLSSSTFLIQNSILLEGQALRVINWENSTYGAVFELADGTLISYTSSDGMIPLSCEPLVEPCHWISAHSISTAMEPHPTLLIIGLSKQSRLYCNDVLISTSTSSFITNFHPHRVLSYTTLGSIA